jgi:hypothetical protein
LEDKLCDAEVMRGSSQRLPGERKQRTYVHGVVIVLNGASAEYCHGFFNGNVDIAVEPRALVLQAENRFLPRNIGCHAAAIYKGYTNQ